MADLKLSEETNLISLALNDRVRATDMTGPTTGYTEIGYLAAYTQNMPGRLSASSTLAEPTSDLTGVTSLYYPLTYRNGIYGALYDGTAMRLYDMSSVSALSTAGLGHDTLHDVFMYPNSGTPTMEFAAWTQPSGTITDATNATPIVITSAAHGLANGDIVAIRNVGGNTAANGVFIVANKTTDTFELSASVGSGAYTSGGTWRKMNLTEPTRGTQSGFITKNGDPTRRLLGSILADAAGGAVSDTIIRRGVSNLYNMMPKNIISYNSGGSYVYSTTAEWRETNSGSGSVRAEFVSCKSIAWIDIYPAWSVGGTHNALCGATINGIKDANLWRVNTINAQLRNSENWGYRRGTSSIPAGYSFIANTEYITSGSISVSTGIQYATIYKLLF